MEKTILIGTSGWSYEDWVGNFYPESLPKSKFLYYYAQYFRTAEINFSYYSIPNKYMFYSFLKKVPADFVFTVKLHRSFTHQKDFDRPYDKVPYKERDEFLKAVEVLKSTKNLDTLLAQFPQSFHYSQHNLEYLIKLKNSFEGYNLAVEFRNKEWVNDIVLDTFRKENITFVSVDEPDIVGLMPREFVLTNSIGYIRFHSRDKNKWYEGEKLRYDYFYSNDEMLEWVYKIRQNINFEKLYVYFNNCHNGQAVQNALMFRNLISD